MEASLIFLLGLGSSSLLAALMIISVLFEGFRFWPPGERNISWFIYWTLATINLIAVTEIFLNSFNFTSTGLYSITALLTILLGILISVKAIITLGAEQTSGLDGGLVDQGLYSYSRNPQVVGNLISIAGFILYTSSTSAMVLGITTSIWLISMIFSEEQKLKEELGRSYKEYLKRVPRFI